MAFGVDHVIKKKKCLVVRDRLRAGWLNGGGVPREQKLLKGHLSRVMYHPVYSYTKRKRQHERFRSGRGDTRSQFENNYLTEMCSGSEAGSYLRLIDFVCHSNLGLRVKKKKSDKKAWRKSRGDQPRERSTLHCRPSSSCTPSAEHSDNSSSHIQTTLHLPTTRASRQNFRQHGMHTRSCDRVCMP